MAVEMCGARFGVLFVSGGRRDAGPIRERHRTQTDHSSISAVIRDLDLVHIQCQDSSVSGRPARAWCVPR
jgi:hypothetical protein